MEVSGTAQEEAWIYVASSSKKTTSGNTTGKRGRPKNTPAQVKEPEQDSFIRAEVMIIISFAVAVLLFLSNFHLCGVAGDFLRSVQLGIFGTVGFVVPLLIFIGTSFYMSNRGNPAAVRKLLASVLAVLVVCGFLQLFFGGEAKKSDSILDAYKISSSTGSGGGLVGGLIYTGLGSVLGTIGTFLVLAVGMAISVVCITERSIVKAVQKSRDAAYQYAKEDLERRKEQHAERQEERKRLREEQRVRGVDLVSTDLSLDEALAQQEAQLTAQTKAGEEKPVPEKAENTRGKKQQVGSNADVFTGEISLPTYMSSHEPEDETPFEADEVLDPAESAQHLVAQGIAGFDQADDIFTGVGGTGSKPEPALSERENSRRTSGKSPADREDDFRTPADFIDPSEYPSELEYPSAGQEQDGFDEAERFYPQEEYGRETLKQLRPRTAPGTARTPDAASDRTSSPASGQAPSSISGRTSSPASGQTPSSISGRISSPASGQTPSAASGRTSSPISGQASPPSSRYAPGTGTDMDLGTDPDMGMNPAPNIAFGAEDADVYEDITTASGDPFDDPPFEEDGYTKRGVNGGELFIPEETKRVTTASGKVIETETELLKKKLETRKQEKAEQDGEASVQQQILEKEEQPKKEYIYPPLSLLKKGTRVTSQSDKEYRDTAIKLQQTLRDFGVGVTVTNISCGPSVTRYELHPEQGVKVSKIVGLADDIKLSLAAADIRIEAPIPGKSAVGIEVPNKENNTVYLRELLEAESFQKHSSRLAFAVGKDIGGQVVVADIAKMPHLLIAGATGSGKSVCINTLIMSIIYKSKPEDVKLIMVDPKVVELSVYNGIPHLLIPVVTDPKKASGALNWAVAEMTDRYKKFAEYNVRDLKGYNAKIEGIRDIADEKKPKKLPQIVIIVDELADLMMVAPGEVEDAICRLAQLARAAGIHLVIATQRPSVNVITGLIKANVPSRIAFSVSSGVDSRTIIDMNGAEKLLGKGDMLFYPAGYPKPQRVQGAFVSDQEVQKVVDFLTEQGMTSGYNPDVERQMNAAPAAAAGGGKSGRDDYFEQAGKFIIEKEKASIGMLQRVFKIGFNRAARIMDQLAEAGVVGDEEGTKPRKVLMTMEEFEEFMEHK